MENNYRILKLKNGDSVIAGLLGITDKNTLILERPMQFKTMTMMDDKTLITKDFLLIRNWAEYCTDRNVEIPNDSVLAILTPDDKIAGVYDLEKKKVDNPEQIANFLAPFLPEQPVDDKNIPQNLQSFNLNLQLPPDASQQFLELLGIEFEDIDDDDLDDDLDDDDDDMDDELDMELPPPPVKKSSQSPKKKESEKPTWGNSLEDWSPDPNDYLK